MKLYNLKNQKEIVNFSEAVQLGLGTNQGLFFPVNLPIIKKKLLTEMLEMDFITRSSKILNMFIENEIESETLYNSVKTAFSFTGPIIKQVEENISCLEIFHGPTLAFKDFGARFMAQILSFLNKKEKKTITILTATSGDTGAAVAHAFYKMKNIRVVILYPKGKISQYQEKLFCTLGHNITTIAIDGSFDDCQTLVKQSFQDIEIRESTCLNSANSINISRLLAQICYYFEAFSITPIKKREKLIISVPCGNFGNLTAGLLAKSLGLPVKSFIAATNSNDTVPRFLENKIWDPKKTISTISNAMDISQPNNWPRVEQLFKRKKWDLKTLGYGSVSDKITKKTLQELYELNYISEPHAAVAYRLLKNQIKKNEYGLFLGTAHPSKFKNTIEKILNIKIPLPSKIQNRINLPSLSYHMDPNFLKLRNFLLKK
ncbi:threonine synthase [Buchnera aphidicola (Kurisakia onigurumii)]|uniref:threonine synthase n=1 Tax=Buchnera aphidicola TaxID=9 RepID=UPI0031B6EE40